MLKSGCTSLSHLCLVHWTAFLQSASERESSPVTTHQPSSRMAYPEGPRGPCAVVSRRKSRDNLAMSYIASPGQSRQVWIRISPAAACDCSTPYLYFCFWRRHYRVWYLCALYDSLISERGLLQYAAPHITPQPRSEHSVAFQDSFCLAFQWSLSDYPVRRVLGRCTNFVTSRRRDRKWPRCGASANAIVCSFHGQLLSMRWASPYRRGSLWHQKQ